MTILLLDGKQMTDRARAHEYLKRALSLPPYYGMNLDALHDCLYELPRNTVIFMTSGNDMLASLGIYGEKLLTVLDDAARDGAIDFMSADNQGGRV